MSERRRIDTREDAMTDGDLNDNEMLLEAEKLRLYEEIRNYPTPIAGCDQQFNYLLEQQARVAAELNRLRAIAADRRVRKDPE